MNFHDGVERCRPDRVSDETGHSRNTAKLSVGSHAITVVYGSVGNFASATSAVLAQTVKQAASASVLTSSALNASFGKTVTLTATIGVVAPGAGSPTGTVTFKEGSTVLATVTLVKGVAVFSTANLAKGKHTITAVYGGDLDFAASTSMSLIETIVGSCGSGRRNLIGRPRRNFVDGPMGDG
jgi:hypothetical protein